MCTGFRSRSVLLVAVCGGFCGVANADPTAATFSGLPPQIVPSAPEVGVMIMQLPGSGNDTTGAASGGGSTTGGGSSAGSGSAYAAMMATSYGSTAAMDAQSAGISADALAAIGEVESGFQNVPTANGSSSATGPWQILQGTFSQFNTQYGLGYSPSDITDPTAQAEVASYIIKDYASTVSQSTGQPATVLQTYGAYVFGPSAGSDMATAIPSAPLSQFVSPTALANNNMTGWTVGEFNSVMGAKLGSAASETVTTPV
jgi:Transglycosylase SLT domain